MQDLGLGFRVWGLGFGGVLVTVDIKGIVGFRDSGRDSECGGFGA